MELVRGVCSLCSENTRVLTSSDAEEYSKFLPNILYENFLPEAEFQKIKSFIKICAVCCYKIQIAIEVKDVLSNRNDVTTVDKSVCCFCKTDQSLMQVDKNWKNFFERYEGYLTSSNFSFCSCPKCFFYFDLIYNFKTKLSYKFPQLATQKKKSHETPQRQDTPKRKSLPKSPPSSKKRKIFDNCFTYLQPLCNNNNYQVNDELKRDKRLYKKIAYVNLKNVKDVSVKETPKMRPIIKIKLKPRNKKGEKGSGKIEYHISKSEEVPIKSGQPKYKRRHSHVERSDPPDEPKDKLDETPKSAIVSNIVPKRRVSEFMDNGEKEEEKAEENEDETMKTEDIEEKTDETALDEQSKSPEDPKEERNEELDKNGIDKSDSENIENNVNSEIPHTEDDVVNGEKSVTPAEISTKEEESQKSINEDSNSSDSSNSSVERTKTETSSEGSDSGSNEVKEINNDTPDTDVLNGSERKKKRVTFSDEIND